MKRFLFVAACMTAVCMLVPGTLQAQQTKRSLLPNGDFEQGIGNWMVGSSETDPIEVYGDEDTPISGNQSMLVLVSAKKQYPWDQCVRMFFGVQKHAKYKISFKVKGDASATQMGVEMNMNVDGNKAIELDKNLLPEGFIPEITDTPELRGTIAVSEELREYVFYTSGTQDSHHDYQFSFRFGKAEPGAYWIDDVKISRADDQDWDGNLCVIGDFEGLQPYWTSNADVPQNYVFSNYRPDVTTVEVTEESPLGTGKALHVKRSKEDMGGFWGCGLYFITYVGEDVKPELSFRMKGATAFKRVFVRTNAAPWNAYVSEGGGDLNDGEFSTTGEEQHISVAPRDDMDSGKLRANPYYPCSLFSWIVVQENEGDQSLNEEKELWIDDIVIKQAGLKLEDFSVLNVPESLKIDATQQLKIAEMVQPNNANPRVEFIVEDGTGKATIDQNGILTGVKEGTVTVKVVSIDNPDLQKTFQVNIEKSTSIAKTEVSSNTYIYPTQVKSSTVITVTSPEAVSLLSIYAANGTLVKQLHDAQQFAVNGMPTGIYYVKIFVGGETVTKKFVVQ